MNIKTFINRNPLISYFILAYTITWGAILAFLASKGFQFAALQLQDGFIMFLLMLLGPSMSSLILTAVLDGRKGLGELWQRIKRWQVGLSWYAAALLIVPLSVVTILWLLSIVISPSFVPSLRWIGPIIGLIAGFIEEIGWTGFATPRLLEKHSPFKSGLILGLLWAFWHMLADFSGNINNMGMAGWVPWFIIYWIFGLTAYRILMTWIYTKTRSVLVAQLMHASYTGWLFTLSPDAANIGLLWQGIFAAILWALVVVVFWKKYIPSVSGHFEQAK